MHYIILFFLACPLWRLSVAQYFAEKINRRMYMKTNMTKKQKWIPAPGLLDLMQTVLMIPGNIFFRAACTSFDTFYRTLKFLSPKYLEWASMKNARLAALHAASDVPAYARFVSTGSSSGSQFPETDKDNYIRAFSTEDRCLHGVLPEKNIMIDESSSNTYYP